MTGFGGVVDNAFEISGREVALMLTDIDGLPREGMRLSIGNRACALVAVGQNSTDGKVVSTRACLTGKPVAPYGSILIAWQGHGIACEDLRGMTVCEEVASV